MPLFRALVICLLVIALFLPVSCGRKPAPPSPEAAFNENPAGFVRNLGVPVYPGSEVISKDIKTTRVKPPGAEKAETYSETTVASLWFATDAPVDKVRRYYEKAHPHLLTERTEGGEAVFLQLSTVPNIDAAIAEQNRFVSLVDIRKKRLSPAERAAYQNELESLQKTRNPDLIQRNRITEVERLLAEKTLVQLTIRRIA